MPSTILERNLNCIIMKKSVKITAIVIFSLIIVLAVIGIAYAISGLAQYQEIYKVHADDDAWFNTLEYANYKSKYAANNMQIISGIALILCASSLLIDVVFWKALSDAINTSDFYLSVIMNRKTIKVYIPIEIIGMIVGVALYLIFQFVMFNDDTPVPLAKTVVVLTFADIIFGVVLFMITAMTVVAQRRWYTTKDVPSYQRGTK